MLDKMDPKKLVKKLRTLDEKLEAMQQQHTDACFGFGNKLNPDELTDYRQTLELYNKLADEFCRRYGFVSDNEFNYHPSYFKEL